MDWEALKYSISQQQTIVFIGEGVTYNYQNPSNEMDSFNQIAEGLGDEALSLHQKDGLFILKKARKTRLMPKLNAFYGQDFQNPILEKLIEIPFHLLISITPDVTLKKAFLHKNYSFQHDFYKLNQKDKLEKPSGERPLLYNLFGCIEGGKDDLYVEHRDLFNYVKSIYNPNSEPPDALLSYFTQERTDTIIFLGCDFDKWYFQLILHLLKIHTIESSTSLHESGFRSDWKSVYEEGFKINFITQEMANFVNELHAQFEPEELRQAPTRMIAPREYLLDNFMRFFVNALDSGGFSFFCMSHYAPVFEEFVEDMGRTQRISLLLNHVRKEDKYEELLSQMREENPKQYENHSPYYEEG